MAQKRDVGDYQMIEVVYQRKDKIQHHRYHQYSFIVKRLYNSKRDAVQATTDSESILRQLCEEKLIHIDTIKVITITVKKCTVYLWDTSRI